MELSIAKIDEKFQQNSIQNIYSIKSVIFSIVK